MSQDTDPVTLAADRLQPLWAAWDDPAMRDWNEYFARLEGYPGGSGGYVRDLEAVAKDWVTTRRSQQPTEATA